MRIDLPKMNKELRDAALKAMGAQVQGNGFYFEGSYYYFQGDKLVGSDASTADQLKRAYAAEVVKYTARKNGWQVKQVGQYQFQVVKG